MNQELTIEEKLAQKTNFQVKTNADVSHTREFFEPSIAYKQFEDSLHIEFQELKVEMPDSNTYYVRSIIKTNPRLLHSQVKMRSLSQVMMPTY